MLSKHNLEKGMQFKDLLSSMFSMPEPGDEDEDDY
jgi:magnesium chelatase subunit I